MHCPPSLNLISLNICVSAPLVRNYSSQVATRMHKQSHARNSPLVLSLLFVAPMFYSSRTAVGSCTLSCPQATTHLPAPEASSLSSTNGSRRSHSIFSLSLSLFSRGMSTSSGRTTTFFIF